MGLAFHRTPVLLLLLCLPRTSTFNFNFCSQSSTSTSTSTSYFNFTCSSFLRLSFFLHLSLPCRKRKAKNHPCSSLPLFSAKPETPPPEIIHSSFIFPRRRPPAREKPKITPVLRPHCSLPNPKPHHQKLFILPSSSLAVDLPQEKSKKSAWLSNNKAIMEKIEAAMAMHKEACSGGVNVEFEREFSRGVDTRYSGGDNFECQQHPLQDDQIRDGGDYTHDRVVAMQADANIENVKHNEGRPERQRKRAAVLLSPYVVKLQKKSKPSSSDAQKNLPPDCKPTKTL